MCALAYEAANVLFVYLPLSYPYRIRQIRPQESETLLIAMHGVFVVISILMELHSEGRRYLWFEVRKYWKYRDGKSHRYHDEGCFPSNFFLLLFLLSISLSLSLSLSLSVVFSRSPSRQVYADSPYWETRGAMVLAASSEDGEKFTAAGDPPFSIPIVGILMPLHLGNGLPVTACISCCPVRSWQRLALMAFFGSDIWQLEAGRGAPHMSEYRRMCVFSLLRRSNGLNGMSGVLIRLGHRHEWIARYAV